jgi:hypothetical protein
MSINIYLSVVEEPVREWTLVSVCKHVLLRAAMMMMIMMMMASPAGNECASFVTCASREATTSTTRYCCLIGCECRCGHQWRLEEAWEIDRYGGAEHILLVPNSRASMELTTPGPS